MGKKIKWQLRDVSSGFGVTGYKPEAIVKRLFDVKNARILGEIRENSQNIVMERNGILDMLFVKRFFSFP